MNTKLTVSIDHTVIEGAKRNLQTKEKSLSRLIEDYFRVLLSAKSKKEQNTPIVDELSGVASLTEGKNERDTITEYLLEKY